MPDVRVAKVFLTNQTATIYKLLSTLAAQEAPPRTVNDLTMNEIQQCMMNQFHPKRFVERERFRYWSDMKRKPGETVQELAARIKQAAATCDFANIENPLDEALRTRFICSINNEAVLKALFKINDDELNFEKAVQVATKTEEVAMVAKETVYGTSSNVYSSTVAQVSKKRNFVRKPATNSPTIKDNARKCYRCGNFNHLAPACKHKFTTCRYCNIVGHLEIVCRKKAKVTALRNVQCILVINLLNSIDRSPKVECTVSINSQSVRLELDTATSGNFISTHVWSELGEPELSNQYMQYQSASGHDMPIKRLIYC